MKTIIQNRLWLALTVLFMVALGAVAVACSAGSSSSSSGDDDTTDDDASPADDDDDDDASPSDCPPITQAEADRFYWPGEPPFLGGQATLGVTVQGVKTVEIGGPIAVHASPASIDEAQWMILHSDAVAPGSYDLTVPEGGTLSDGNSNIIINVIFGFQLSGAYSEWWVAVSGCVEIDELGWIGGKFTGHLQNVAFRRLLNVDTGEIDWTSPAHLGFDAEWDAVNQTITSLLKKA